MYDPGELASFALSEFERGIAGLTSEEAQTRFTKADGTQMNAISWIVRHITVQWRNLGVYARTPGAGAAERSFFSQTSDPTPPTWEDALLSLVAAKAENRWMLERDYAFLDEERVLRDSITETVGTYLARTVLHTWFHTGEINAIRQLLGHPEIRYVGPTEGRLEWRQD